MQPLAHRLVFGINMVRSYSVWAKDVASVLRNTELFFIALKK